MVISEYDWMMGKKNELRFIIKNGIKTSDIPKYNDKQQEQHKNEKPSCIYKT